MLPSSAPFTVNSLPFDNVMTYVTTVRHEMRGTQAYYSIDNIYHFFWQIGENFKRF